MRYGDLAHPGGGVRYGDLAYAPLGATPTVTGPATMQSGQPATFTVANFGGAITTATVSGVDASASISQTGDQVTITVPDMFAAGLAIRAHTVVMGDGTDTAQDDVDLVAPDGWTSITLSGYATIVETVWTRTLDAAVSSIADDDVFELVDGDLVWYFNDGANDLVVNEDGTYNLDEQFAPLTIGRIAYFPDSQDPEAGPDGIYSVMGDYTIQELAAYAALPFGVDLSVDATVAASGGYAAPSELSYTALPFGVELDVDATLAVSGSYGTPTLYTAQPFGVDVDLDLTVGTMTGGFGPPSEGGQQNSLTIGLHLGV